MRYSRHAIALAAIALLASPFAAPLAHAAAELAQAKKGKWPECFCTDRYGKRRELGEIICITIGERSYEAKCVMAQNNPFWRDLNRGCLNSHNGQSPKHA